MDIRDILCCPKCKSKLSDDLVCSCGHKGVFKNGLYYLLDQENPTYNECEKEKTAWINVFKDLGMYFTGEWQFELPEKYYKAPKEHLDYLLGVEDLNGKVVLDIGACLGWAEAYILNTKYPNANLIALDCNDDPIMGLGRTAAYKEKFNIDFDCVISDMLNLPFKEDSIDIIFTLDALHHASDLSLLSNQVYKILKPGGRFYALNEAYRPEDITEKDYINKYKHLMSKEIEFGVHEFRPSINEYITAGAKLNLQLKSTSETKLGHLSGIVLFGEK
jgi:SAM-dependent methyltransferase